MLFRSARAAREHNDANVLAVGGRVVTPAQAVEIVRDFLSAQFAGGRHQRRIDKISQMEQSGTPQKTTGGKA